MLTIGYRTVAGVVGLGLLAGLAGCGDKTGAQMGAMNSSNIQRLSNMYSAHQVYKGGRGPKDEADLKAFIKGFDPDKLAMMKIEANNPDAIFTSERDGKPFKVRYNVSGGMGSV